MLFLFSILFNLQALEEKAHSSCIYLLLLPSFFFSFFFHFLMFLYLFAFCVFAGLLCGIHSIVVST